MKTKIKILTIFCLTLFALSSCIDNEPDIVDLPTKDVDFYYTSSSINYVIKEEVNFYNTSIIGSSYKWDFGDGTTSVERNPTHRYEIPGNYTVTLIADDTYKATKSVLISNIVPRILLKTNETIVFDQTTVSFEAQVDNPEKEVVTYNWTFPAGTRGEGIDENGRYTSTEPQVKGIFNQFGSMTVTLQVNLGEEALDPINLKVKVNYDKPARTLYYAEKDGNLMAKKLSDEADNPVNNPFDTQLKSGKHALNLIYYNDLIYVFDAGTKTGFVDPSAGLGDGEIFAISTDWTRRETIIENFNGDSYMDFFYGYIDKDTERIYWADRRDGIRWIPLSTRNEKFNEEANDYWVRNETIGYYGRGISWGNTNGPIFKYNGLWHWGKNSTGKGLFRFTEGDIGNTDAAPTAGIIMSTYSIRGIAVDEEEGVAYVANSGNPNRIVKYSLDNDRLLTIIDNSLTDSEGGTSEPLFVTGLAIDKVGGYLYWAYRGDAPEENPDEYYAENPLAKSGIKRIKLSDMVDGATVSDKVEYYVEGVEAFGLTIDTVLR